MHGAWYTIQKRLQEIHMHNKYSFNCILQMSYRELKNP